MGAQLLSGVEMATLSQVPIASGFYPQEEPGSSSQLTWTTPSCLLNSSKYYTKPEKTPNHQLFSVMRLTLAPLAPCSPAAPRIPCKVNVSLVQKTFVKTAITLAVFDHAFCERIAFGIIW